MLTEQLKGKHLFLILKKQKQKLLHTYLNDTHKNGEISADGAGSLFVFKQIFTMTVLNILYHFRKIVKNCFVYFSEMFTIFLKVLKKKMQFVSGVNG